MNIITIVTATQTMCVCIVKIDPAFGGRGAPQRHRHDEHAAFPSPHSHSCIRLLYRGYTHTHMWRHTGIKPLRESRGIEVRCERERLPARFYFRRLNVKWLRTALVSSTRPPCALYYMTIPRIKSNCRFEYVCSWNRYLKWVKTSINYKYDRIIKCIKWLTYFILIFSI